MVCEYLRLKSLVHFGVRDSGQAAYDMTDLGRRRISPEGHA